MYFFLANQRQVEYYFERVGVSSNNDQFGDGAIESLGSLIRSLLDLLQGSALSDEIADHRREFFVGEGLGSVREIFLSLSSSLPLLLRDNYNKSRILTNINKFIHK